MTKEEKLRILKGMRERISKSPNFYMCSGFCWASSYYYNGHSSIEDFLLKLGLKPPKVWYNEDFWYDPYDYDKRIKILDNLIKKLMQTMSQNQRILDHLKKGKPLNPLQALNMFGCFRLGARIFNLKCEGHRINTEMVTKDGKRFARYSYEKS